MRHKKIARHARRRKHARRHVGHIGSNTKVYSAAAWWRDSDPSMQVIALDEGVCKKQIKELMKEEAEHVFEHDSAYDNGRFEDADDALNGIAWSGVHAVSLGSLVSDRELEEAIHELRDNGYYYPETP